MKIKYIFIFAFVCALSIGATQAQNNRAASHSKWMKEVREYKYEKLIEETDMTKAQQNDFLPLYRAMEQEIYQVNLDARKMEAKITNSKNEISDYEYGKAADTLAEAKLHEAQIELDYYHKFEKILSKKQLFKLKRAENRFTRDMLGHYKRGQATKKK